ncbi:MAG: flagellar hook-associated protein 2 [Thermotogota bacterium]|nr:flagellar hook-associated protein 2 [Thermotogota bacterium]MDK2864485.1 flagellar hook-associated protein 2 [Thermotogota bacterium]HCZ06947.1 flagellar hook protein FliD [Thermotogota bacterium]
MAYQDLLRITGSPGGVGDTQFLGLSGVDTGSIIDAIMEAKNAPLENLQIQQEKLELKQRIWQEIDDRLESFRSTVFSMKLTSTFYSFTASSSDENSLQVSATTSAVAGTFYVRIEQLSSKTVYRSGETIGSVPSSSTQFSDLDTRVDPQAGTFTINGVEITINATDTIDDIINKINASGAGVTASYDAITGKVSITSPNAFTLGSPTDTSNLLEVFNLSNAPVYWNSVSSVYQVDSTAHIGAISTGKTISELADIDGVTFTSGTIMINGTSISVSSTDTLEQVLVRINAETNVTAYYDENEDKLIMVNNTSGSQGISFDDGGTGFFKIMGWLDDSTGNDITLKDPGTSSKVVVSYDGTDANTVTYYTNGNTLTVNGVTLNLKAVTTNYVTVNVNLNVDAVVENITSFVDSYNETMEYIYNLLNEEPVEDKEWNEMTEEEKMQGLLKNDSSLRKIFEDLREWMTSIVRNVGVYDTLMDIGISTSIDIGGGYENMMRGHLEVDEDRLRTAVQEHLEDVMKLFTATESVDGTDGLAVSLDTMLYEYTKFGGYIDNVAGINGRLQRELTMISERIVELAQRLQKEYETLYRKFTAMEQAVSYFNAQSAWLAQALSSRNSQ